MRLVMRQTVRHKTVCLTREKEVSHKGSFLVHQKCALLEGMLPKLFILANRASGIRNSRTLGFRRCRFSETEGKREGWDSKALAP